MNDNETKVSVIVPIYNAEKYLEECVNSIINQTFSNLQIILVNDGSTDNSWSVCQKFEKLDDRITAVTQKNGGVSVARNTGLEIADGDWIMFVDPDDKLNLQIIGTLLSKAGRNIDIVSCACYGVDKQNKRQACFFDRDRLFNRNKTDLYLQLINPLYKQVGDMFTAIGVPWGKIYKKSFLTRNNLKFDPKLRRMQDNIFNMYAFYYADSIYYLNEPLYYYRLNHITDYNKKHINKYQQIFLPVINARYECIKKLRLDRNSLIFKAYLNEAKNMFFNVINNDVQLNNSSRAIVTKSHDLANMNCFSALFNKKNRIYFSLKDKVKLFLVKYNMYTSIYRLRRNIKR